MKFKEIIFLGLSGLVFSGCVVSGSALKNHNMSNRFIVDKNYIDTAIQVQEMLENCASGIYKNEKKIFKSIGKSAVNMTDMKRTFYYYHVDIEKIEEKKSQVIVYTYMNNEVTRNISKTIESWLTEDSKECVLGL